ncbi:MAG: type II toxin-antitoxin system VapC family toxin [Saprospiraceae bacterium]|nr:type II toxin-antitoxin system VapC family toxin [Saprospiraceae bacterium]
MGTGYLVDTNIAIYMLKGILPENAAVFLSSVLNGGCIMSVISRIELLGFAFPDSTDEIKAWKFIEDSAILSLSDAIADQAIEIRKLHKIKLGDTLIAATALVNDLTLLTRNDADFKSIAGLKLVNPFVL